VKVVLSAVGVSAEFSIETFLFRRSVYPCDDSEEISESPKPV
jgi:hypothetical protein